MPDKPLVVRGGMLDLDRDGLRHQGASLGLGFVDFLRIRRHVLDAAAVEHGDFGAQTT